jgi:acyl carrier protein
MKEYDNDVWQKVSFEISKAKGITGDTSLLSVQQPLAELGLDSLKLVEIVYQLESFYQLDVDEEPLSELEKVGDLIALFSTELSIPMGALGTARDCENVDCQEN